MLFIASNWVYLANKLVFPASSVNRFRRPLAGLSGKRSADQSADYAPKRDNFVPSLRTKLWPEFDLAGSLAVSDLGHRFMQRAAGPTPSTWHEGTTLRLPQPVGLCGLAAPSAPGAGHGTRTYSTWALPSITLTMLPW